jgi:hypothetical protein
LEQISAYGIFSAPSRRHQSSDPLSLDLCAVDDYEIATCRKDVNIGAGLLIGYNFVPVDMKFIQPNAFYSRDIVGLTPAQSFF